MPAEWSTVRVFISSTFRDMHAERDHLVKVVFPALRERLEPLRLHLVDIDLRWGITAEQAERDQVLELCLDFIDECRPFFLGLLGDRYGWVPSELPDSESRYGWTQAQTGTSVTELEIQWGVLLRPEMRGHALFFFRDAGFLADLPDEFRPIFAAENEQSALKQSLLKQTIRTSGLPVEPMAYRCRFDGLRIDGGLAGDELSAADRSALDAVARDGLIARSDYERLTAAQREIVRRIGAPYLGGLEEFGRQVLESLWNAIQIQYRLDDVPAAAAQAPDPLAAEDGYHERFIESRLRVYVGRSDLFERMSDAATGNRRIPCVVSGRSGSGKSAAMAKFSREFARAHPEVVVISHFVGASPDSVNLRQLLHRFCSHLLREFNLIEELPADVDSLAVAFRKLIAQVPSDRCVVMIIDALDQLDETDLARGLHWLPAELPEHVGLVVSVIELPDRVHPVLAELSARDVVQIAMASLTDSERREIVRTVPSISAKTLDSVQIELLLDNPETANPLYLLVALEELRGFGSFEQLNRRIASFPRGDDAVTALFRQVIVRLEREFRRETVQTVLTSLSAARRGLSDRELLDLVEGAAVSAGDSRSDLFPILRQLRAYLQRRGPLIGFFHRNLDRAVREHYFSLPTVQPSAHQRLADYFRGQGYFSESLAEQRQRAKSRPPAPRLVNRRAVDELPWQLLQVAKLTGADDPRSPAWDAVAELLTDWRFLEAKAEAGK